MRFRKPICIFVFILLAALFAVCAQAAAEPCAHEQTTQTVITAPTCTEKGKAVVTCDNCGYKRNVTLNALGHDFTVTHIDPTCTEEGADVRACSRCDVSFSLPVEPLGHNYATTQTLPTCTATGTLTDTCTRCGDVQTFPIPALGHSFGSWETVTPATYRAAGQQKRTCRRCSETETLPLPQLAHLPADYCPTGDADMDGAVTAADARLILRLALRFDDGLDSEQHANADFDGENGVTAADARYALRVSVGLHPYEPTLAAGYTFKGYTSKGYALAEKDGMTYVVSPYGYTLIANKTYSLPSSYAPGGLTSECSAAFNRLANAAAYSGLNIYVISGYRSYSTQYNLYNRYVAADGRAAADTYSARPGHSEHQTGLAMDVNSLSSFFAYTAEGRWLAANAHKYGFVIRYAADKENITGYIYEPWHIRYLGVDLATAVYNSGLCLEEFFGITSQYSY